MLRGGTTVKDLEKSRKGGTDEGPEDIAEKESANTTKIEILGTKDNSMKIVKSPYLRRTHAF